MKRTFEVRLEETPVGLLSERDDGRTSFRFIDSYQHLARRPVLSQSFEDDLQKVYVSKRAGSLPAFFANLVPEGKLRAILVKTFALAEQDDLSLLEIAARDMPGATSLVRIDVNVSETSDEPSVDDGAEPTNGLRSPGLRFSLAGVQLKFSMLRDGERFLLPGHDLRGEWIVKPGSGEFPGLVQNEWSMLMWARAAGMTVPESFIVPYHSLTALHAVIPEGMDALAVKRYDREGSRRIHQEDFAQVLGRMPDRKYDGTAEELVLVARALLGEEGYFEAVRRLVFVVICGNHDAHLKNWSLLYRDGLNPSWTPLYDQVATIAWPAIEKELGLKLAGIRDALRIDLTAFERMAAKARAGKSETIAVVENAVDRFRKAWNQEWESWPLLRGHADVIRVHWSRMPLVRRVGPLE